MSIQELVLQNKSNSACLSNQMLGVIGMLLSPMLVIAWFFAAPQFDKPSPNPFITSLGGFLYLLGAMASATGMRSSSATGSGSGAKILYAVQMTGLFLAMWFDIFQYVAPQLRGTWLFLIADIAYPFSHVLMIVVAVAVLRAKVWRRWQRVPAFLVGLALPSFIALSIAFGRENGSFIFPLMVTLGFFTLGLAVYTSKENSVDNEPAN